MNVFLFIKTEKGLFLKTNIDTEPNFSLRQCWWRPRWQFSNPHNHSGLSRRESIPSIGSLLLPITITKDPPYTSGCFGNGWNPSSLNFLLAALLLSAYGMTFCRNPCYVQISGFLTCLLMQRNQTVRFHLSRCLLMCASSCSRPALSLCELQLLLLRSSTMRWASSIIVASSIPESGLDAPGFPSACSRDTSDAQTWHRQTHTAFKASVSEQVEFSYNSFELRLPLSSSRIHVFSYLVFPQEELQLQTEEPQPLHLCRSLRPSLHRLHLGKTGKFEMLRCDFQHPLVILLWWTPRYLVDQPTQVISEHIDVFFCAFHFGIQPFYCRSIVSNKALQDRESLWAWRLCRFLVSSVNWTSPGRQRSLPPGVSATRQIQECLRCGAAAAPVDAGQDAAFPAWAAKWWSSCHILFQ